MTEVGLVFSRLKNVFNRGVPEQVVTTNFLFRTYVTLTPTLLFLSSILVFTQQLLGNHIKCLKPNGSDIRTSVINQYCFITGTYTVPSLFGSPLSAHVGVGEYNPNSSTFQTHHYFQWVPFVLFVQAMIFHLPNLLWRSVEKSRIQSYCKFYSNSDDKAIKSAHDESNSRQRQRTPNSAAHRFYTSLGYNWLYVPSYFLLEIMNLVILAGVCILTDRFLNGNFQNYGIEWIRYLQYKLPFTNPYTETFITEEQISPMDKIFPKVSKCSFKTFGPTGQIVNHDIMCVLSLNVIHEKLFLLLWFWCGWLFLLSCINVLYRFVLMIYPSARRQLVLKRVVREEDKRNLKYLWKKLNFSDWFILKRLSDNMDQFVFGEFVSDVYDFSKKDSTQSPVSNGSYEVSSSLLRTDSLLPSNNDIHYRKGNSFNRRYQGVPSTDEADGQDHEFRQSSAPLLISNLSKPDRLPQTVPSQNVVAAKLEQHFDRASKLNLIELSEACN